jgi:hypothetical protein
MPSFSFKNELFSFNIFIDIIIEKIQKIARMGNMLLVSNVEIEVKLNLKKQNQSGLASRKWIIPKC